MTTWLHRHRSPGRSVFKRAQFCVTPNQRMEVGTGTAGGRTEDALFATAGIFVGKVVLLLQVLPNTLVLVASSVVGSSTSLFAKIFIPFLTLETVTLRPSTWNLQARDGLYNLLLPSGRVMISVSPFAYHTVPDRFRAVRSETVAVDVII